MNQVTLIGNSGNKAELRYTPNNTPVCKLSIATSEKKGEKWRLSIATSEKKEEEWQTTWHTVVLWGKLAETMAPRIDRGTQVFVQGKLSNHEWEKNGQKIRSTEIVAFIVKIIEKAPKPDDRYAGQQNFGVDPFGDVPF